MTKEETWRFLQYNYADRDCISCKYATRRPDFSEGILQCNYRRQEIVSYDEGITCTNWAQTKSKNWNWDNEV